MMSRSTVLARLAMLIIGALALWGMPQSAAAQSRICFCNYVTIRVDPAVGCNVNVCYQLTRASQPVCQVVAPGGSIQIPCQVYAGGVQLCSGGYYWILDASPLPPVGTCSAIQQLSPTCCIQGCRAPDDAAGCQVIDIIPAACLRPC